jgi:hypothetical protein
MKQKSLLFAVLVLLASNVFCIVGWNSSINQVDKYHYYYKSTEALLDTLENEYNWIDAIDNYEYYDAASKLRNN